MEMFCVAEKCYIESENQLDSVGAVQSIVPKILRAHNQTNGIFLCGLCLKIAQIPAPTPYDSNMQGIVPSTYELLKSAVYNSY